MSEKNSLIFTEALKLKFNQPNSKFRPSPQLIEEYSSLPIDVQVDGIRYSAKNIRYVKNQTIAICLALLNRNGASNRDYYLIVKIVPNPTHEQTLVNLLAKQDMIKILK